MWAVTSFELKSFDWSLMEAMNGGLNELGIQREENKATKKEDQRESS